MTNEPAADHHANGYTLTLIQAARLLGVRPKTLQRTVKAGQLPHLRIPAPTGVELRFRAEDVLALSPNLLAPPQTTQSGKPHEAAAPHESETSDTERKRHNKAERSRKADAPPAADAPPGPLKTRQQVAEVAGQVQALDGRLTEMNRQMGDLAAHNQALLQAQLEWGQRFAEASARAERTAAEAAAYRERAAWLEGLLSDATRQIAELRALPAPAAVEPDPPAAPHIEPPPIPAPVAAPPSPEPVIPPVKPWWRRWFG
ncbi:MAG: helix-turn-helix domain-containing protein [Chloroflexi bacterium]|nr:helix-turn-helix domain-containing protein [Chloroflexota bacterium]